ncbi:MAG: sulfatase-like hydrolase/transferase, partial [Actinomycetota bacterium]|nr:sulfatase-like hydrolase/transferase [Actinomycetota bacterium]
MQKVRLVLLAVCWAGVVTFGIYVAEPASSQDERPNVLIIVTDDQRERDEMLVMPETLRIFGEGGTRFTHAFATTPQCCPSRASIFTGRYAHNTGVRRNQDALNLNQMVTMQRYLQQRAGYKTALVGRYLNAWDIAENPPFFDRWALFNAGYWENDFNVNGEVRHLEQYATDFIAEQSIEFLEEFDAEDDEQRWLMYVT